MPFRERRSHATQALERRPTGPQRSDTRAYGSSLSAATADVGINVVARRRPIEFVIVK
jgi:hypothetical protein